MQSELIYVSSRLQGTRPHTHARQLQHLSKACAGLVMHGVNLYCPLLHRCMMAATVEGLERRLDLYAETDATIMTVCKAVLVIGRMCEVDALSARANGLDVIHAVDDFRPEKLAITLIGLYPLRESIVGGEANSDAR